MEEGKAGIGPADLLERCRAAGLAALTAGTGLHMTLPDDWAREGVTYSISPAHIRTIRTFCTAEQWASGDWEGATTTNLSPPLEVAICTKTGRCRAAIEGRELPEITAMRLIRLVLGGQAILASLRRPAEPDGGEGPTQLTLDADVASWLVSTGDGWRERANATLWSAMLEAKQ